MVDHIEHTTKILIYVDVRNPHDMETESFEKCGAGSVTFGLPWRAVGGAVDLHDQLAFKRDEIDHISVDRVLAAKLPASEAAISQRVP